MEAGRSPETAPPPAERAPSGTWNAVACFFFCLVARVLFVARAGGWGRRHTDSITGVTHEKHGKHESCTCSLSCTTSTYSCGFGGNIVLKIVRDGIATYESTKKPGACTAVVRSSECSARRFSLEQLRARFRHEVVVVVVDASAYYMGVRSGGRCCCSLHACSWYRDRPGCSGHAVDHDDVMRAPVRTRPERHHHASIQQPQVEPQRHEPKRRA